MNKLIKKPSKPFADIFKDSPPEALETTISPIPAEVCPKCNGLGYYGKSPVRVCMACYLKKGEEQHAKPTRST